MPKTAQIIVSSNRKIKIKDHKELLKNAAAVETPKGKGGKIRKRLVEAFQNFVGEDEQYEEYWEEAVKRPAQLKDGFDIYGKGKEVPGKKKKKTSSSYLVVEPEATTSAEKYHKISSVSAGEIAEGKESVKIFYDLAAMVKELKARGLEAFRDVNEDWVLARIEIMMRAKAGFSIDLRDKEIIEIIAPFILVRFKAKQSFLMSENGILDLRDGDDGHRLAEMRPFYYNHSTDLRKDPDRDFFTKEKRGGIFNRNPGRELQNTDQLKERFKATVGLQIKAAIAYKEGCFIAEPNEFFFGLAPSERIKAQKLFLEAAIEAIRDFQGNNLGAPHGRSPIFLQSSVANKDTKLVGLENNLHVVRDFNPAYFDAFRGDRYNSYMSGFNPYSARIAQPVMAGSALGVIGEDAVGSFPIRREQTESNLLIQAPMIACIVAPQNNESLLDIDWLRDKQHVVDVSDKERKIDAKGPAGRPLQSLPQRVGVQDRFSSYAWVDDEEDSVDLDIYELAHNPRGSNRANSSPPGGEEGPEMTPRAYEMPVSYKKFDLIKSPIVIQPTNRAPSALPSQNIEVLMARRLDGKVAGKARSVVDQRDAFRLIPSIYQLDQSTPPDQAEIIGTFFNIIVFAAAEAGISKEEALWVIDYVQSFGNTSDLNRFERLSEKRVKEFRNFSGYCQEHAGKCGLYTPDEEINGELLGCRLNSFPKEAIDKYKAFGAEESAHPSARAVKHKEGQVEKLVGLNPVASRVGGR